MLHFNFELDLVISELSYLLSKAGISIYYLSTYECDYILVSENDFQKAMDSLKVRFQILSDESGDLPNIDITSLQQHIIEDKSGEVFQRKSQVLECTLLPEQIHVCSWSKEGRKISAHSLLNLIFFSKCNFFAFTESEEEITLVIEEKEIKDLSHLMIGDPWVSIQRFKKTSLSEIGVISALSKPITSAKVPIFYLSTFNSAFILVLSDNLSITKMVLEKSGYKLGTLENRLSNTSTSE